MKLITTFILYASSIFFGTDVNEKIKGTWVFCEAEENCTVESPEFYVIYEDSTFLVFDGPFAEGLEPTIIGPFLYSLKNDTLYSWRNDTLMNAARITFKNDDFFYLTLEGDDEPIYFKRKK
ncbi:MAG: hypothetical protein ACHQF2_09005 [Flavobacteriales bacterium]